MIDISLKFNSAPVLTPGHDLKVKAMDLKISY